MKLRTRLFVWIGSLFIVAFVASLILENYLTRKHLGAAEARIKNQIVKTQEVRRVHTEKFLRDVLLEVRARIEAQVFELGTYSPLKDDMMKPGESWLSSATYLATSKWIDFIQVGKNSDLESLIVMKDGALSRVDYVEPADGVVFAHMKGEEFVAIPIEAREIIDGDPPYIEARKDDRTRYYVLFTKDAIMKFNTESFRFPLLMLSVNPLQPFLDWVPYRGEVRPMSPFAQSISKAQAFLKAQPKMLQRVSTQAPMHSDEVHNRTKEIIDLYEQVGMIWGLSTFALADESVAPTGMARRSSSVNLGLLGKEVFYKTPQIQMGKHDTGKFSIFPAEDLHRVFFGRSVDDGKITIGLDGGQILKNLSIATNEHVLFFADGDLIAATDRSGNRISSGPWNQVLLSEMIGHQSGFVKVDGEEYFYLHLKPVSDLDFHFFLFQPKEEAFKLVYSLDKDTKKLLHVLSLEMRIIAVVGMIVVLTLLHFVSRRITKPIARLAGATKQVAEGKYEEVNLPESEVKGRHDEVGQLYHSFREMIDGMIEKERVRGVLNKVVSSEIAEEILKEDVHLGGEEREVTVLFGDIRQFTKLTEKMAPAETIELLNECMTRIAKVIDAHGGVIDKFVGDEVMALFGAPIDKPASTLEAVKCGIEIIHELRAWNEQRKGEGLQEIEMGIGIHRGKMIAGNMGAENRLNYTVIGANVNMAFRFCSEAKPMEVVISESVQEMDEVTSGVEISGSRKVAMKGFSEEIEVFEVKV